MTSRDVYSHYFTAPADRVVLAVTCSTCRTVALYKSTDGATNATMYHLRVCSEPRPRMVEILGTSDTEMARRAPIPE